MRGIYSRVFSALIILAVISAAGCLNYTQEVNLYPDGSGTMDIHYWAKVDVDSGLTVVSKSEFFNKDSITANFTSKFTKVKSVTVSVDSTDSTIHAKVQLSFTHIDSLNNTQAFSGQNFRLEEGAAGQMVFTQFIPPPALGMNFEGSSYTVTYIYDFPGEIITHNATQVNKKQYIWKYKLEEIGKGKTISVSYRPFKLKETPYWIYVLSGSVLLIVLIFLFRKKRD